MCNIKFKKIVTLFLILLLGVMTPGIMLPKQAKAEEKQELTTVVSYNEIFEFYYNKAIDMLSKENINMPHTYEDFCEGFYSYDFTIEEYTEEVVAFTKDNKDFYNRQQSRSSGEASYLLKNNSNPTYTPMDSFIEAPNYNGYDGDAFDYSMLQEGDIIYEAKTWLAIIGNGHVAIIVDMNHQSYYGEYIQTVEAVPDGVKYGYLDDTRMVKYGVEIFRVVDADEEVVNDAITFCEAQVGDGYNDSFLTKKTDYNGTKWYCSELIYAAYYNAGIDLGYYIEPDSGLNRYYTLGILPSDLRCAANIYAKGMEGVNYLDIDIIEKIGMAYEVRIFNNTGLTVTMVYNKKMCFENDAKNWINLNDTRTLTINDGQYTLVTVSENYFATSIAFCNYLNGTRYITYANSISVQSKEISFANKNNIV